MRWWTNRNASDSDPMFLLDLLSLTKQLSALDSLNFGTKCNSRHGKLCPAGVLTSNKLAVSLITPFISAQISRIY